MVSYGDRRPHYQMLDVFRTIDDTMEWIDPHRERIWEEPAEADDSCVLIARRYKPGSVSERMG